jgi:signal transduction histidine kinase
MTFLQKRFSRPVRPHPPERELAAATSPSQTRLNAGDFAVAQMVHDVQSQLAVMVGCADNLLAGAGQADRQIAELHRRGEHATRLTRAVLTAAQPVEVRRALNLNEIVTHAGTMLSCVTGPWIRMQFRLAPEPVRVFARIFEIERILLNIVLNARDAIAADGTITIETAIGPPGDAASSDDRIGPGARLTITDTGAGMSEELRERIFEPFFTTKEGATGLGLPSVAFTVQQLGGTVAVRSRPGGGTSVVVLLPQVRDLVY